MLSDLVRPKVITISDAAVFLEKINSLIIWNLKLLRFQFYLNLEVTKSSKGLTEF